MPQSSRGIRRALVAVSALSSACAGAPKQPPPTMKTPPAEATPTAASVAPKTPPADATGLATGQTYTEAMRVLCELQTRHALLRASPPQRGDPFRAARAMEQLDREVRNLQARALLASLATMGAGHRMDAIRHAMARAGICNCKGLPPGRLVRSCDELRSTPPPPAPDKTARTLREALQAFCDPALQLAPGPAFVNDGPDYKHAAYVDARVDNATLRRILNFRGGGDSDGRRHRMRLFQHALRRAGLDSCATLELSLPAAAVGPPVVTPPAKRLGGITGADGMMCVTRAGGLPACVGDLRLPERLGPKRRERVETSFPVGIPGLTDTVELTAGSETNVCALRRSGELVCWYTHQPQPGGAPLRKPTVVQRDVRSADSTDYHLCTVSRSGSVRCWGTNWCGETGSTKRGHRRPATILKLPKAVQVTVGRHFSCAVTAQAKVYCWGDRPGETSDAVQSCKARPRPRPVPGLSGVQDIAAGEDHVCALTRAGEVWCWGDNRFGQLADGSGVQRSDRPVRAAVSGVAEVEADDTDTCVRHRGGAVSCWGYGFLPWRFTEAPRKKRPDGVADHAFYGRLRPTRVPQLKDAKDIMVGDSYACALLASDRVTCFGARVRVASEHRRPIWETDPRAFHEAPSLTW